MIASYVFYQFYTLWLFTYNDLKTMVFPSTCFAIFNGLPILVAASELSHISAVTLFLTRLPSIVLWTWINLLVFAVNNQRQSNAIIEDRLNKPWRPIPAGRLTPAQAKNFARIAFPSAFLASIALGGGIYQCSLLAIFGFLYNDRKGGDINFLLRNILNACGFTSFASGALEVLLQSPIKLGMLPWLLLIGAVVCTTVHTQDMYDQVGDSAAGRKTVPLVVGDSLARWTIAITVAVWSVLCPLYWRSSVVGYVAPVSLGLWVGIRSLANRKVDDDRTSFRIYNIWLVSIYALPLIKFCAV